MNIVVFGLTITSTWGNGHATTYRALLKALSRRGHHITFFERDKSWYRGKRDDPRPEGIDLRFYDSVAELETHRQMVQDADIVMVGSYVPEGQAVAEWVHRVADGTRVFYDIDTPVTLRALEDGTCPYIDAGLLRRFDVVFSFAGGEAIRRLEREFGIKKAVPLLCSVDTERYAPRPTPIRWSLGYLGTHSDDRQPALERLFNEPARQLPAQRFAVGGSKYPEHLEWPSNVERLGHLPQDRHVAFYAKQSFTLNVTRQAMVEHGHAPSVRLFEAAATGTPIISDPWPGLDDYFREGQEIIVAHNPDDVLAALEMPEGDRRALSERARRRVLRDHTADRRADTFEDTLGLLVDA